MPPPSRLHQRGVTVLGKSDPVALTAGGNGIGFQFPEFAPIIGKKKTKTKTKKVWTFW